MEQDGPDCIGPEQHLTVEKEDQCVPGGSGAAPPDQLLPHRRAQGGEAEDPLRVPPGHELHGPGTESTVAVEEKHRMGVPRCPG
jgi:hypothetical protein